MFRTFAGVLPNPADLFLFHPSDLTAVLEFAWDRRFDSSTVELGHPFRRSDLLSFSASWMGSRALTPPAPPPRPGRPDLNAVINAISSLQDRIGVIWDHLIYAYMIENTRIYDIFGRVVRELLHGEKLGIPSAATHQWLRSTEELFFRDPPPFFITAVNGYVRPDIHATRRNAYQRMFGMDLNHGTEENKPYSYSKAEASNKEFAATFEEFLREVWVGIINVTNTSGSRPTDDSKIADLAKKLHDMLISRRVNGNLSREEFVFVSMMSWFHLSVSSNTPVVVDLRSEAASAEQRLFKIAQQAGLPAHGLSASYFDIADAISRILLVIETGLFSNPAAVPALYTPGPIEQVMRTIITHWSTITGRDVKAGKVAPS
jgi:hypothetical protein